MEALLIVFGGPLLVEILLPLFSLVAYGVFCGFVAVIDLSFTVLTLFHPSLAQKTRARPKDSVAPVKSASKVKVFRRAVRVVSILGAFMLTLLLLIETVFFDDVVKYAFSSASSRMGGLIEAESIEGSLFAGRLNLGNVRLRRTNHRNSNYDINIHRLAIDVDMLSMLSSSKIVEAIAISDVSGSFECLSRPAKVKKRKQYVIGQLTVSNTKFQVIDRCVTDGSANFTLNVESLNSHTLRSSLLPFDFLFNTNANVEINGGQLKLANSSNQSNHISTWQGIDLSMQVFRHYLGRPMLLISSGALDFTVRNEWPLSNATNSQIETDWDLLLKDFSASVPKPFTVKERVVATPVVMFLNTVPGDLPIKFKVTIKDTGIDFVYSALTDSFASVFYDGLQTLQSKTQGLAKEKLLESGREKVEHFKKKFPGIKFKRE